MLGTTWQYVAQQCNHAEPRLVPATGLFETGERHPREEVLDKSPASQNEDKPRRLSRATLDWGHTGDIFSRV